MEPLTIADILAATGGAAADSAGVVSAVCTDTRAITPGSLFVALRGDAFDGHDYLAAAAAGGAVAALVDRDVPAVAGLTVIRTDDARRAMGRLATFVRRRFKGTVIAVAGSNGKTGTKHLIHAALSSTLRGSMSPKSFNNDVGVPVTLFAADPTDDFVVLELGTNHPGEIAHLSRMAEPDVAVITNIGAEHLEFFGDLAGVAKENAAVTDGLGRHEASVDAALVYNADDERLPHALEQAAIERRRPLDYQELPYYGVGHDLASAAKDVRSAIDGVRFRIVGDTDAFPNAEDSREFHVPLLGRHTATNAVAALYVGRHLGLTDDDLASGLARVTGPAMRLQLERAGPVTILNDAYNANPTSVAAALDTVRELPTAGRRIAVLGDMLEMGPAAAAGHADVGRLAAAAVDLLVCVGPLSAAAAAAAKDAHLPVVYHVLTTAEAAGLVPTLLRAGDLVLLKASRGLRFEAIAKAIHDAFGPV